jgi:competence protein ComEA
MVRTISSLAVVGMLLAASLHAQSARSATAKPAADKALAVVNLNTAAAAELETLPGIGARTAARIIEYRQKNGPFKKIEELMNVQGIGEKSFLKLKPQLTVSSPKAEPVAAKQD